MVDGGIRERKRGEKKRQKNTEIHWKKKKKVSIRPPQIPRAMKWDRNFSPFRKILYVFEVLNDATTVAYLQGWKVIRYLPRFCSMFYEPWP